MMRNKALLHIRVLALILLAVAVFAGMADIAAAERKGEGAGNAARSLEGKWVRPDGGYILDLQELRKDGTIKAAYFNPSSINVHSAGYKVKKGKIDVFVELRDLNYPGSKYHLAYDPRSDGLKGTYFQAVEGRTFDVEFVRSR